MLQAFLHVNRSGYVLLEHTPESSSLVMGWLFAAYCKLENRYDKVKAKCEVPYDPLAARIRRNHRSKSTRLQNRPRRSTCILGRSLHSGKRTIGAIKVKSF